MIRFNWDKLNKAVNGDCKKLIQSLEVITGLRKDSISLNKGLISAFNSAVAKDCYLLNLKDVLLSKVSYSDKCTYIWLASLRNWADYEFYGKTSLPYYTVQHIITIQQINSSNILELQNKQIIFKYER